MAMNKLKNASRRINLRIVASAQHPATRRVNRRRLTPRCFRSLTPSPSPLSSSWRLPVQPLRAAFIQGVIILVPVRADGGLSASTFFADEPAQLRNIKKDRVVGQALSRSSVLLVNSSGRSRAHV
jgi:hypothetical protein